MASSAFANRSLPQFKGLLVITAIGVFGTVVPSGVIAQDGPAIETSRAVAPSNSQPIPIRADGSQTQETQPLKPAATSAAPIALPPLSDEEMGDLHMAHRRYQAALESYAKVSQKSASTWNKIGIANQQLFITEEARKSYERALKLDPKYADALNNLGSVYYSMKEYSNAERLYRRALKFNPKSALLYKNLGTDLLAAGKFKKGRECYQIALAKDPEIFERNNALRIGDPTPTLKRGAINYYLAKSYAQAGMPERAVGYLRMAIDEGFTDRKKVMADHEFASLHGFTPFEQLLAEQQMQ